MCDVIIVGARCAGSALALLLARRGSRVLLVDHATFPSDMPMSSHFMHQRGIACLARWGLREQVVATPSPPVNRFAIDVGPFTLTGTELRGAVTPRSAPVGRVCHARQSG
jgi:2-polyprenyl-6-methoxyphenol hydroxylase-like FAD-dependent oxidoreductase